MWPIPQGGFQVFVKCAVLILTLGVFGASLLSLRQARLQLASEVAQVQLRIVDMDEELWLLRTRIAALATPQQVEKMAEGLGPLRPLALPPLPAPEAKPGEAKANEAKAGDKSSVDDAPNAKSAERLDKEEDRSTQAETPSESRPEFAAPESPDMKQDESQKGRDVPEKPAPTRRRGLRSGVHGVLAAGPIPSISDRTHEPGR